MDRVSLEQANFELEIVTNKLIQDFGKSFEFVEPLRVVFFNNERKQFRLLTNINGLSDEDEKRLRFCFDTSRESVDNIVVFIYDFFKNLFKKSKEVEVQSLGQATSNPLLDGINESVLPPSAYDVLRCLKEVNNKNISNMLVTFSVAVEKYISYIKDPNKKEKSFEIELTPEMANNIKFREILEHLGYTLSDTVDKETSRTFVYLPVVN